MLSLSIFSSRIGTFFLILFAFASMASAKERPGSKSNHSPYVNTPPIVVVDNKFMQVNNINTIFRSDGIFNSDFIDTNFEESGLIWPVTAPTIQTIDFATGLWLGAYVGGYDTSHIRTAACLFASMFSGGDIPVVGQVPPVSVCNDSRMRVYQVWVADSSLKNGGTVQKVAGGRTFNIIYDSWSNWPVDLGAPYVNVSGVPGYHPELGDRPGIGNSNATPNTILFTVYMDYTNCTNNLHAAQLSLPGGTLPMGVEVQQVSFAWNSAQLEDMYFTKFKLINKSSNEWDSTFVAVVNDFDEGNASGNDVEGCDSANSLGIGYSVTNSDPVYGTAPPAAGQKFLQGPLIHTGNPNDTAKLPYDTLIGYRELGMTGFNVFKNVSNPCLEDPQDYIHGYNWLKGNDGCGNPLYNWAFHYYTHYDYTGNYCQGSEPTGWYDTLADDGRICTISGPFTMHSTDTQLVVVGIFLNQSGANNIANVCDLIQQSSLVQTIYNSNFEGIVGVKNISSEVPKAFALHQNYPNPFNPSTKIRFELPKSSFVTLKVYDVTGRLVATLINNESLTAGLKEYDWDAGNFSSGVYFYRIEVHQGESSSSIFVASRKMVLLK